jgi:ATP-dependent Clp protease adaptor protein ClpS
VPGTGSGTQPAARSPPGTTIEIGGPLPYLQRMPDTAEPLVLPDIGQEEETKSKESFEPGYLVVCWDDPVNLMDYVTHVFQRVFGWSKQKAEFHMLQVHNEGKSVLARESMEKAEHYVHQLQKYTLHATMERD